MTTKINDSKKNFTLNLLRTISQVVVVSGAAGSFGLMLRAGRNNPSLLLLVLFAAWDLSPFLALLVSSVVSKRWPVPTRVTLYCLMLFITLGSLLTYSGALSPPGTKPAFVFLVVPLISWLLIVIVIPIAISRSRRKLPPRSDSV